MSFAWNVLKSPAVILLFALFAIFFAASSFASPRVGDLHEFLMTNVDSSGREMRLKVETEIVSYDAQNRIFTIREKQTPVHPSGPVNIDTLEVPESDLMTRAQITERLTNCASLGGRREVVRLPAGEFQACRISENSVDSTESIWYADVPQGVVKSELQDHGSRFSTKLELQRFRFGR